MSVRVPVATRLNKQLERRVQPDDAVVVGGAHGSLRGVPLEPRGEVTLSVGSGRSGAKAEQAANEPDHGADAPPGGPPFLPTEEDLVQRLAHLVKLDSLLSGGDLADAFDRAGL